MKSTSRVLLLPASIAICFAAAGCAQSESTLASLRENPILRNAARAVLIGKSYDRAAIAARNNNPQAFQSATSEMEKIDPLAAAEQLVLAANQLDIRAMQLKNEAQRKQLETQAAEKYRHALRIAPEFSSRDANLLNALGYFLADRGESKSDFQKAEKFTRAALKIWDAEIAKYEDVPLSGPLLAELRFNRAQGPQDSLAWALFKQGRLKEARNEQLNVLKETQKYAPEIKATISGDLYFHMGEIERALGKFEAARKQYEAALKVEPDHTASSDALLVLPPSTPVPRNPAPEELPAPLLPEPSTPEAPDIIVPETGSLSAKVANTSRWRRL